MDEFGTYAAIALFGLLGLSIYRSLGMNTAILIIVEDSRIIKYEGVSRHALTQLEEFFLQDVELDSKLIIRGQRDDHGHLRYQFKGSISTGTQQQIRNFLHTVIPPAKPKSKGNECA